MKEKTIKPKKYTLHECKKELFLFAQSVKSIADRLEQDAIAYDVKFPKYSASELRDKANLILEKL